MELFNLTTLLLFSSFILLLIIKTWRKPNTPPNLPPSPPSLPVIGHLHHLRGGEIFVALEKLKKKYGSIVNLKLGQVTTVVISSREAAKEAMKSNDPACADRADSVALKVLFYNYSDIVLSPYNESWRQLRRICISEMLSPKNVRSFGYIRAEEVDSIIKSLQSSSGQAVNVSMKMSVLAFSVTCRATLGDVLKGRDTFIALLKEFSPMSEGLELADLFPSFKLLHLFSLNKYRLWRMRRQLDAILDPAVEEHKLNKKGQFDGEDFVDVLIRMQRDKQLQVPITNDNIKAVIVDMLTGGTETSATIGDWAMAELMKNPRVMAKAQKEIREIMKGKTTVEESDVREMKYLKLVAKETMRLHPPIPIIARKCRVESKVGGYTIPINAKVMVNVRSLGRDSEYWEDPECFLPERFENSIIDYLGNDFELLPFGAGKRVCPGQNFGIANVEFPLAKLLYHFDWKLPQGMTPADLDMTEGKGITISRKNPLLLIPTIYYPSN